MSDGEIDRAAKTVRGVVEARLREVEEAPPPARPLLRAALLHDLEDHVRQALQWARRTAPHA